MGKKIDYGLLNRDEILDEVMKKKEFRDLPREDVSYVYDFFDKEESVVERIKKTRDLLRKMYTAFVSDKLLKVKDKEADWFLRKHISTFERMDYYLEIYDRILSPVIDLKFPLSVFDFGCGINGFSYPKFLELGFRINYFGTEPVGQLCDLQNSWFEKRNFDARIERISLFDLNKNVDLIKQGEGKKVGLFFKVLDSLEMVKRNYSKEVLKNLMPFLDRGVISWATSSLIKKKKFHAERKWLKNFVCENFEIVDEFDFGVEHYLVFENKK